MACRLRDDTFVRGLLRCLDVAFFIEAFEEEGYRTLGDLRRFGEEEVSGFVASLAMPRGTDERLLAYAYADGLAAPTALTAPEHASGASAPGLASASGLLDEAWLEVVRPLYAPCMGCENMGPLLYSLVRFTKPQSCLEIGAGYTSAFLLQALEDNCRELQLWRAWQDGGAWFVPREDAAVLHCVDNLAHAGTTAHLLLGVAQRLRLEARLRLHLDDARAFVEETDVPPLDFVWLDGLLDFARPPPGGGIGEGIDDFLSLLWPKVAPGGFVLLHSTLTNSTVRGWLRGVENARWGPPGAVLSLLEPHKRFQNSVTLLQRRPEGFSEPLYSKLP